MRMCAADMDIMNGILENSTDLKDCTAEWSVVMGTNRFASLFSGGFSGPLLAEQQTLEG